MRDLIDIVSGKLFESRGLGARKAGEEFVSLTNPDDKIFFQKVDFYPEQGDKYISKDETAGQLKLAISEYPKDVTINLVGTFKANDLAFGIAEFKTADDQRLVFVKPFQSINPDPTLNHWDNQKGIPGYRYNSKVAAKSQAGLMPQDVLTTKSSDLKIGEIIAQVEEKFGTKSPLSQVINMIASGQEFPITIPAAGDISFTAFTDYFCEILHPISLILGTASGNSADAAQRFLGPNGFKNATISFGQDKTEGLSDSVISNTTGKKLKVSSKAAFGATASTKNLWDLIRESQMVRSDKEQEVVDIVETVVRMGQRNAPLVLGKRFDIISEEDERDIIAMDKQPLRPLSSVNEMKISANLKKLIKNRVTDDPLSVNFYFHSLAAVAHKVAEYINENTDFSQVASELLNNGALVQVYTKAREKKDFWVIDSFRAEWPGKSTTGVKFQASKTYYSTGIKGNFTFKILRNNAKDIPDERQTDLAQATEPAGYDTKIEKPKTHAVSGLRARRTTDKTSEKPTRSRR